jgi:predicted AlkP superfamily phosphohydrolase/phosphomutase
LADLAEGEWSPWILEPFETVDGKREGTLRFKLEELSRDARVVRAYCTQLMDVDSYAFPVAVGRELYEEVGPFITDIAWEGLGHDAARGEALFHESVMVDLAEHQQDWFAGAVRHLTSTRPWDLVMLQAHCIDCANHHCLSLADPASNPDDRELGERYLGFIETLYDGLDRMLGKIMEGADDETVILVVSDHGGLAGHLRFDTADVLQEAGLTAVGPDGETDWSRTRAYRSGLFVNVNMAGREANGIVPPEEYEKTCDEIIAALHAHADPATGLHPYNLTLRKSDMRYIGLYGDPTNEKIGDVVYTLKEPFGGNHGEQLSTAAWGLGSNGSIFIMKGPGIKAGKTLERTVWLTDIVPTICHLLDAPVPRDAQGGILYQALEDIE